MGSSLDSTLDQIILVNNAKRALERGRFELTYQPTYSVDQREVDSWFEKELPSPATQPLFDRARECAMAMSFGYAELTPDGQHFNAQGHATFAAYLLPQVMQALGR